MRQTGTTAFIFLPLNSLSVYALGPTAFYPACEKLGLICAHDFHTGERGDGTEIVQEGLQGRGGT